ncbi:hypothetical protein [Streptomyces sp. PU-14G]|uniref:hypothetical protein n=1 Tax=Streptomyces sp. PU-14G TaxID=2800808 RepID=UPI0034E03657
MSSQVFDVIAVHGEVSRTGPGVRTCEGRDRDRFFTVVHTWSVAGQRNEELREAMTRLTERLPGRGWQIHAYGRNSSHARTLELSAEHPGRKFALNVELWDQRKGTGEGPPKLLVHVASACHESPEGQEIERF